MTRSTMREVVGVSPRNVGGLRLGRRMAQFVTVRQAAAHLGVSPRTIWRRIADDTVPAYKLGGVTRIDLDELEAATREGAA